MAEALLDGLRSLFGDVFSEILPEGKLIIRQMVDDGKGGWTQGQENEHTIHVMRESVTDVMREAGANPEKDTSLIILQENLNVELTVDSEVIDGDGIRWKIRSPIVEDPVKATWIALGSPV